MDLTIRQKTFLVELMKLLTDHKVDWLSGDVGGEVFFRLTDEVGGIQFHFDSCSDIEDFPPEIEYKLVSELRTLK